MATLNDTELLQLRGTTVRLTQHLDFGNGAVFDSVSQGVVIGVLVPLDASQVVPSLLIDVGSEHVFYDLDEYSIEVLSQPDQVDL